MSRQLAELNSLYHDLLNRYGPDDPVVAELRLATVERESAPEPLPHGERRKVTLAPHLWPHSPHAERKTLAARGWMQ